MLIEVLLKSVFDRWLEVMTIGFADIRRHVVMGGPRSCGAVFEQERRGGLSDDHLEHEARPVATQRRAQSVVQDLKRHRGVFRPGEHQER